MKNLRNKFSGVGGGGDLKVQERRGSICIILIKCINIQHFDFN